MPMETSRSAFPSERPPRGGPNDGKVQNGKEDQEQRSKP